MRRRVGRMRRRVERMRVPKVRRRVARVTKRVGRMKRRRVGRMVSRLIWISHQELIQVDEANCKRELKKNVCKPTQDFFVRILS